MESCNGKVIDNGVDPWMMGRWAYNLIAGLKNDYKILVFSGYRTGLRNGDPE